MMNLIPTAMLTQFSIEDISYMIYLIKPIWTECVKVGVMIRKYKMSEEEILKIWDEFHAKHPDGFMTKESFLDTKEVTVTRDVEQGMPMNDNIFSFSIFEPEWG